MNMPQSLGNQALPPEPPSLGTSVVGPGTTSPPEHCWPVRPTLRNELDTFSVHFYIFFGPSVALPPERPAVFALRLLPVLDSGGVFSLELQLNVVLLADVGGLPCGELREDAVRGVGAQTSSRKPAQVVSTHPYNEGLCLSTVLANKHALSIDFAMSGLGQPGQQSGRGSPGAVEGLPLAQVSQRRAVGFSLPVSVMGRSPCLECSCRC